MIIYTASSSSLPDEGSVTIRRDDGSTAEVDAEDLCGNRDDNTARCGGSRCYDCPFEATADADAASNARFLAHHDPVVCDDPKDDPANRHQF